MFEEDTVRFIRHQSYLGEQQDFEPEIFILGHSGAWGGVSSLSFGESRNSFVENVVSVCIKRTHSFHGMCKEI